MAEPEINARMRDDWNARAREDAGYYVAFGRRDQDEAGFFATATDVINGSGAGVAPCPLWPSEANGARSKSAAGRAG